MRPPNHLDASAWMITHHSFNSAGIQSESPRIAARLNLDIGRRRETPRFGISCAQSQAGGDSGPLKGAASAAEDMIDGDGTAAKEDQGKGQGGGREGEFVSWTVG